MKDLPQFIVYQPNKKEFHICFEVGNTYYSWWSYYPPTQDNRFARKVTRLRDITPQSIPSKQVYDKGTYTINKGDDKATAEKKLKAGIKEKSFSFILNGKQLKGRFIIKQTSGGTVIQKFKDQFVVEEDVLGGDLSRTIRLMVPNYDETKVKLNYPRESKYSNRPGKKLPGNPVIEEAAMEEISADKKIGNTLYHFVFYNSETAPDICIVVNTKNEVAVLQKSAGNWKLLKAATGNLLRKEKEMIEHAKTLYELQ